MYKYIVDLYDAVSKYEQLETVAGAEEKARAKVTQNVFNFCLKNNCDPQSDIDVLEIGPASGYITRVLSESVSSEKKCYLDLMDFSPGFLENVKSKNYQVREYICSNITDTLPLAIKNEKYNMIFFQEVLEHLISPYTALVNLNSMLKNGGNLFITVPNANYWRRVYIEIIKPHLLIENERFLDTHISEMSTTGIVKLVTMAGFDVQKIYYYCTEKIYLSPFFSSQVGFLLTKKQKPPERWSKLQCNIIKTYK